jgi:drug/metabolite transporter (DMT)-like permease
MLSILAIPILKQKLSFKALVALIISFLGVLAISFQGPINDGSANDTTGIILALFSSIAWATYWLLQVKSRLDKSIQLFLNFSISFVLLCFLFIITKQGIPHTTKAWLPCIWIGFFEMGITFYLWMSALKYAYRTDVVSNLAFLTPFISLFFINLVLHESISINTVIGLCLIIGGILIQQLVLKKYNGNKIK